MTDTVPQDPANLADRLDEARQRAETLTEFGSPWKYRNEPQLEGVVLRTTLRTEDKTFDQKGVKDPFRIVEVERADGELRAVFCDKYKLRLLDEAEKPEPGDRVLYDYAGDDNERGECQFALVVERGSRPASNEPPVDAAADESLAVTQAAAQSERDARDGDDWNPAS